MDPLEQQSRCIAFPIPKPGTEQHEAPCKKALHNVARSSRRNNQASKYGVALLRSQRRQLRLLTLQFYGATKTETKRSYSGRHMAQSKHGIEAMESPVEQAKGGVKDDGG